MLLALGLAATCVEAGRKPDMTVSWSSASPVAVGGSQTYTFTATNNGNRNAESVTVVIDLLKTNTSPNKHLMKSVSNLGSGCTLTAATITCNLGQVRKGKDASRSFDYSIPVTEQPLDIKASVSTPTVEASTSNNAATLTIVSTYHASPLSTSPATYTHKLCAGQGLTEFYACEVSPTSITSHAVVYHADNTLSFPDYPTYSGTWAQASSDVLTWEYILDGVVTASFSGKGAGNGCFEGITTFPANPAYNAAYQVCKD